MMSPEVAPGLRLPSPRPWISGLRKAGAPAILPAFSQVGTGISNRTGSKHTPAESPSHNQRNTRCFKVFRAGNVKRMRYLDKGN